MNKAKAMGRINPEQETSERILAAAGKIPPELILKNGRVLNVFTNQLVKNDIAIYQGHIVWVGNYSKEDTCDTDTTNETLIVDCTDRIICPGFIDGHIHIESSMLSPNEFARAVVPHGTTAVVTDPHEIANVAGEDGINYMLSGSEDLPLTVYLMMPSCVPSTSIEEAGAVLEADNLRGYMDEPRVLGLAELMNSFGTIHADENIIRKICLATEGNKLIDGHGPGLTEKELNAYVAAGVTSDHECTTLEEAMMKLSRGQWIMIREGTAAKNMHALMPLFDDPYCNRCMLVTDDRHPGDLLIKGHMDYLIKMAIQYGADPIKAVKMATLQPALYFGLKGRGAVAPGYIADLVILDDLNKFSILQVYKEGELVASEGSYIPSHLSPVEMSPRVYDSFQMKELTEHDFIIKETGKQFRVIEIVPGELLTRLYTDEYREPGVDIRKDIVKLAVVERHHHTGHIGLGFLKGYGLNEGAIASSIAHDSHNLIIAGTNDEDMCAAGNCVRKNKGGIAIALHGKIIGELALPIAGLMCEESAQMVDETLKALKGCAKNMGISPEIDAFMTLAFLSLPVIPEIRLTSFGLVDVKNQQLISPIV